MAASDRFFGRLDDNMNAPFVKGVAITPNDATELAEIPRGLYIGGAGNLVVVLAGDTASVTFTGIPAGTFLSIRPRKILATSTTATAILALS